MSISMACSVKRAVTEPLGDFLKVHDRLFDLLDSIDKLDCLHSGVRGCERRSGLAPIRR